MEVPNAKPSPHEQRVLLPDSGQIRIQTTKKQNKKHKPYLDNASIQSSHDKGTDNNEGTALVGRTTRKSRRSAGELRPAFISLSWLFYISTFCSPPRSGTTSSWTKRRPRAGHWLRLLLVHFFRPVSGGGGLLARKTKTPALYERRDNTKAPSVVFLVENHRTGQCRARSRTEEDTRFFSFLYVFLLALCTQL